jgi:hypothetical protein
VRDRCVDNTLDLIKHVGCIVACRCGPRRSSASMSRTVCYWNSHSVFRMKSMLPGILRHSYHHNAFYRARYHNSCQCVCSNSVLVACWCVLIDRRHCVAIKCTSRERAAKEDRGFVNHSQSAQRARSNRTLYCRTIQQLDCICTNAATPS